RRRRHRPARTPTRLLREDPMTEIAASEAAPPAGADVPAGGGAASSASGRRVLARLRPLAGPLVLIAMVTYFTVLYGDRYFSKVNLVNNVLGSVAFVAIVAAGQTVVMVVGEFDLSVSGLAALASVSTGVLVATTTVSGDPADPTNVFLAVAVGLLIGLAGGVCNGLLVSRVGILAFIATLATSLVFANIASYRVDGRPVYNLVERHFVSVARGEV